MKLFTLINNLANKQSHKEETPVVQ
uniref:Uncharacterized protein n=1 Tax=Arundo donax TaxID=35708 RepID=A0A0A9GNE6_ARUDO